MATCFVIQPFDGGGKFDSRYKDIFDPAIRDAGLEPYRVDGDPAVSVPIDEIQNGIRRAAACLADITLDNPNVWFELGFALASEKQMCLVCSEERTGKYPFDVQHRTIIKYKLESKADFEKLHKKISERLKAIQEKSTTLAAIEAQSPIKDNGRISQYEMVVLASIMENREGPGSSVSHYVVKQELSRIGYNNLALNIGLEGLLRQDMIRCDYDSDYNGEAFRVYFIETPGMEWVLENYGKLNLRTAQRAAEAGTKNSRLDEEIPF